MYIVLSFVYTFLKYVYLLCRLVCIYCDGSINHLSWGWGTRGVRGWSIVIPTLSYAERSERKRFYFYRLGLAKPLIIKCMRVQESPI